MPEPLISVVIPHRQPGPYSLAAIESVLGQTHRNLEIVIVGHDDIADVIRTFPTDSRLVGVPRREAGIVSALNTGIEYCHGDYIARMDDDDISHPERLSIQLNLARQHPPCLVGGRIEFFSDHGAVEGGNQRYQAWLNSLTTNQDIRASCFIESPLPHPTLFAHRSYWQQLANYSFSSTADADNFQSSPSLKPDGFAYRDLPWPEDYDLILRTYLLGIPMCKPDAIVLQWRDHSKRLTRTDSRYSREAFVRAKAWALCQPETMNGLSEGRGVWLCGTGRNARYWHDALIENNAVVLGFVELDAAKRKTQKRHLPVITYTDLPSQQKDAMLVSTVGKPEARVALQQWFDHRRMINQQHYILG